MRRFALIPLALLVGCGPTLSVSPAGRQVGTLTLEDPGGSLGPLPVASTQTYATGSAAVPLAEARAALPAVYDALGLQGAGPAGDDRFVAPRRQVTRSLAGTRLSRYLDCGSTVSMANADHYAVTLQVSTQLSAAGAASTTVTTLLQATARPVGTAGEPVSCTSTGALEREIVTGIGASG